MAKLEGPPQHVALAYDVYPTAARETLMRIRGLLLDVAQEPGVGPITETLKWGEPSYLTEATKSGSTIRLAWKSNSPEEVSVFFNCKTTLIGDMREMFPTQFRYEGNRGLHIAIAAPIEVEALSLCLLRALTYHVAK